MTPEQKAAADAVEALMMAFESEAEMAARSGGPSYEQWLSRIKKINALRAAHPAMAPYELNALDFCEEEARQALAIVGKRQNG